MTRAQELNVQNFPYYEYDDRGREIYYESTSGHWVTTTYFKNGNTLYESSRGYWKIYKKGEELLLRSYNNNLGYPSLVDTMYGGWTNEMIRKHEDKVNWELISFLPTLSKNIIEEFKDKLNMEVVSFFNENY